MIKQTGSGVGVNEKLGEILLKPVIKKFKRRKSALDLKTVFAEKILLKWDHFPLKIQKLNICVIEIFPNMYV